jgi:Ni,Fe-hydrogenase maturation factor
MTDVPNGILVIGYGNSLRCDDGVGQAIARRVADWGLKDVINGSIAPFMSA